MCVEIREATSKEMERNKKIVGFATGGVMFGEGMEKINWKLVRFMCNLGYTFMPREKGVKVRKLLLGNISAEISTPEKVDGEGIIMYIHGGGLVSGSAKATRGYCSMLAKYSGLRVVSINYRLAPENIYPAAVDDCEEAYLALHEMYPKAKICLTGESGGAYLTTALTIRLINKNEYAPACIIPHSTLCDMEGTLDRSYYDIIDGTVTGPEALRYIAAVYAGKGADLTNPEIDVKHYAYFEKFPPTYLTCDFSETLRADSEHMYKLLSEAGVDVHLTIMKNTFHACSTLGTGSPETMQLMRDNIEFIKKYCA